VKTGYYSISSEKYLDSEALRRTISMKEFQERMLKWLPLIALVISSLVFPRYGSAAPQQLGSIHGAVMDRDKKVPIPGAELTLMRAGDGNVVKTRGDASGKFVFGNVDAGQYRLTVECPGYLPAEYGQRGFTAVGASIAIQPKQEVRDIVILMSEAATIIGSVRDDDRQPVADAIVLAFKRQYEEGRRVLGTSFRAKTDRQGDFQLTGLPPGEYVISTTPAGPLNTAQSNSRQGPTYSPIYYPNVLDPSEATPLPMRPGTNVADLNVRLVHTFTISGTVVDALRERHRASTVTLWSRALGATVQRPQNATIRPDGSFEFPGVPPGEYEIVAIVAFDGLQPAAATAKASASRFSNPLIPPPRPPVPTADPNRLVVRTAVRVDQNDLKDVTVVAQSGSTVAGIIRVRESGKTLPSGLRMQIRPAIPMPTLSPSSVAINDDGTFAVAPVSPGEWRIAVAGLPRDWYMASARIGGADVLNTPMRVDSGDPGMLEIVLGSTVSAVSVTVLNERSEPVPDALVVAIPNPPLRGRSDLYRIAWTGSDGRSRLDFLAPGEYRVFAFEQVENGAWQNPEFLGEFENRGKRVSISNNTTDTIELRLIRRTN
jgi:hypothetical protein